MLSRRVSSILVLALVWSVQACTSRPAEPVDANFFPDLDASVPPDAPRADAWRPDTGPDISNVLIYAHSSDTLYTFSPHTSTVTEIGEFTLPGGEGVPNMLDLAVNAEGDVYTSSAESLFRVDPMTAALTRVGDFDIGDEELFALVFLTAGELREDEALIGATNAGVYYEIDVFSADATRLGNYPADWVSSGDIVSVDGIEGGGTFATLRNPDDRDTDYLARIDFLSNGTSVVDLRGPIGFRQIFGLGFWGRKLYGFSNDGELIEIDPATGAGTIVPTETGADSFWGAGVTTQAPVLI